MKYEELLDAVGPYPLFGEENLSDLGGSRSGRQLQLVRWVRSGRVLRLKRGVYSLPDKVRKTPLSLRWLANTLYTPSYLSLEYALSWYDMIPERVTTVTSVTTLKTAAFENPLGHFSYRSLKRDLFFGFVEVRDEFQYPVLMARPEKAILDFVYFYHPWESSPDFMKNNLRWQQLDQMKKKTLKEYAMRFQSKKVAGAVEVILELL